MNLLLFICATVLIACWVAFGVMEIFYLVRNNKSPDFANEIEVIKQIVESLVIEQNQLTVDKLKLFSKSGVLTEEQAKEVFDYVVSLLKSRIFPMILVFIILISKRISIAN